MPKIERFIISHRSGCGLCDAIIENSYEKADAYIKSRLASYLTDYVNENYSEDSEEYIEFNSLETDADMVEWGEDFDLICGDAFTGSSDWEEFLCTPVTFDVPQSEIDDANENQEARIPNQIIADVHKHMIGKRYRHFKGTIYVVDNIAVHSETAELRVIYHSEEKPNYVWDRNLQMFLSPVDKEKYPNVEQELRFQPID